MTHLLHIGDLHVRRRRLARENRRLPRIMDWVIQHYEHRPKPVLVFTGDLTDNGEEREYERLLELLAGVRQAGFSMVVAPGNHDVGPMGNTFYSSHQNNFQQQIVGAVLGVAKARTASARMSELYPMVSEQDDCVLVGVDSCNTEEYLASGAVGEAQLQKLDGVLSSASKPVVVYVHHHPFVRSKAMAMVDRVAFMECVNNRVDVLLFGHKHQAQQWICDPQWQIPLIIAAGKTTDPHGARRSYELCEIVVGSGPATSTLHNFRLRDT